VNGRVEGLAGGQRGRGSRLLPNECQMSVGTTSSCRVDAGSRVGIDFTS
jgi:hypothetical protein